MSPGGKFFVLDTNVLLHSPSCLLEFGANTVVVPVDVIEELDKFKSHNDELGRNARQVIRILDRARTEGSLQEGAPINGDGGQIVVDMKPVFLIDSGLRDDTPDNRIISVAYRLARDGREVTFISKDVNMRLKADALGLRVEDFETDKVPSVDDSYPGWRELSVSPDVIDQLMRDRELESDLAGQLNPNEAVLLRADDNPKHTALARPVLNGSATPHALRAFATKSDPLMGITPRNLEQRIALELLLDPELSLVSLMGQAGTGKTLLALVAGLHLTLKQHKYEKLLVARPIMPLGRDIGFLPGTAEEKLMPWMKPIFDNMRFVLRERKEPGEAEKKLHDLLKSGIIEIEPLTFIRGRSIHGQFIIVDECQNLTPHQLKTIISRVGHDTKLVLTGDPYQIDNPYLDSRSNGLSYVADRFKNQRIAGHVRFTKSERSRLASIAVEIL
ncbi:MAG: PhoH family protein [Planctomycetes bacterium]|nr:PhoH family protein [Planctomycetota bacterium]